jgi:hypothetical protein
MYGGRLGDNGEFSTGPRSVLSALLVARYRGPRSAGTGPRLSLIRDSLRSFLAQVLILFLEMTTVLY